MTEDLSARFKFTWYESEISKITSVCFPSRKMTAPEIEAMRHLPKGPQDLEQLINQ